MLSAILHITAVPEWDVVFACIALIVAAVVLAVINNEMANINNLEEKSGSDYERLQKDLRNEVLVLLAALLVLVFGVLPVALTVSVGLVLLLLAFFWEIIKIIGRFLLYAFKGALALPSAFAIVWPDLKLKWPRRG